MQEKTENTNFKKDIVAGAFAGLVCGVIYQPLDVIKINLIVEPDGIEFKKMTSSQRLNYVVESVHKEYGLRGFWLGTVPGCLRAIASCAIYFTLLRAFDEVWNIWPNHRHYVSDFLDSGVARVLTSLVTNPLNVLRTRRTLLNNPHREMSLINFSMHIMQQNRTKLFTKGTFPMILEEFIYGGVFNVIYEALNKRERVDHSAHKYQLVFFNGFLAGAIGTVLTHPFEIARAKIQADKPHWQPPDKKRLLRAALKHVYQRHGVRGFLRGLLPRFLKKTLMGATSFSVYEFVRKRPMER